MSRRFLLLLLPLTLLLVASSAIPAAPILPAASPMTNAAASPSFGLNSHLATRYPDPTSMNIPARTIERLGVSWVREDLHWHRVQRAPDVWDWTFTDAALRELLKRDINVLGVLGPSVGWATPFKGDTPHDVSFHAPDPEAFIYYARMVVNRYKRYIKHWEIWNEPDNPLFWKPEPDPEAYADLLIRTSAAIKKIDPEAKVLIGGFNPFDTTFVRTVADAGGWDSFDILAVHPYVDPFTPEEGNIATSLDRIHVLNYQLGAKPIWVTEIGWASGPGDRDPVGHTDQAAQASFLVRSLLLLWKAGVERSFWYMLKDDPHNPYGLIAFGRGRTDFRAGLHKPAFSAFHTLNTELQDARLIGRRDLFNLITLVNFEDAANWQRSRQPNGSLSVSQSGVTQIAYNFSTRGNDYVVFERDRPLPLVGRPYALGLWVYGDGHDHSIKIWLRDAEDELLQFPLGIVGVPGWQFLSVPIGGRVEPGNRIEGEGNGRLDFPARFVALVLDDAYDDFTGTGQVYLDDLTAVHGREVYNMRLVRGEQALDILWSPPGIRVKLQTSVSRGYLVELDGSAAPIEAEDSRFSLEVGSEPVFLWHRR